MTLPPELTLGPSTIPEAGTGVFTTTFIPRNTWLAEYEGEVVVSSKLISNYAFKVRHHFMLTLKVLNF